MALKPELNRTLKRFGLNRFGKQFVNWFGILQLDSLKYMLKPPNPKPYIWLLPNNIGSVGTYGSILWEQKLFSEMVSKDK